MKANFRNIASCILCTAVCATVAYGFLEKEEARAALRCNGIRIEVADSASNKFLSPQEVVHIVDRDFGGYVNRPVCSVDLQEVENVLTRMDFIESCQAFMGGDGTLQIRLSQCSPVLRIVKDSTHIAYLDNKGNCISVEEDWCKELKNAKGSFPLSDKAWMTSLGSLATKINENKRLSALVQEINCSRRKEVSLNLKGRKEVFDLGQPDNLDEKIRKIETFLDRIASEGKEYETVTVKYSGQIVCR